MGNIPSQYQTDGYGTVFSDSEARTAIAVAEIANKIGGGSSGGGITQAEVKAAIEAAANLAKGQQNTANSLPTVISTEQQLIIEAIAKEGTDITGATMPAGGASTRGWLSAIWKLISDRLPTKGATTAANAIPVTLSTDGAFATNFGSTSDAVASSDTGSFSLLSFFKRLLQNGSKLLDAAGAIQATIKAASTAWATTDTALVVTTRDLPIEISGTGSSLNADIIPSTNVSGYQSFALQLTQSAFVGGVSIQGSNDNSNWVNIPYAQTTNTSSNTSVISNAGLYEGKLNYKFFRCRITSYTSGSVTLSVLINKAPISFNGINNTSFQVSNTPSVILNSVVVKTQTRIQGTINTSGDNTIIAAPGTGLRIYITKLKVQLESSTTTTVILKSGATSFDRVRCVNDGDGLFDPSIPGFEIPLGVNEAFIINLSGANIIGYHVTYYVA